MSIVRIEFFARFIVHEAVESIEFTTVPLSDLFGMLSSNASLLGLSFLLLVHLEGDEFFFFFDIAVSNFNTLVLNGTVVFQMRFFVVLSMVLFFHELVDTLDFFAIKSVGLTVILVNETIELVVLSVPFSLGSSCLFSIFSCLKFSIKGGFFILLCLFFLHAIFVLSHLSMMVFMTLVFDFQKFVDSTNFETVALVVARAIVFMDKAIEWVELSCVFRLFESFLCCCSLSGGFVSSINCVSTIVGIRLSLVSSQFILFGLSLLKTIFISFLDLSMPLSIISNESLWLSIILIIIVSTNHSIAADLHGPRSRIGSEKTAVFFV